MTNVDVMQDASEVVHYERAGVPLYVRTAKLSVYPNMQALCHWHDDIELIHILKGSMSYYINGKRVVLKENDSIMVNARQMHYGYSHRGADCDFTCVLFHPGLFTDNRILNQSYLRPILENSSLEYFYFDSGDAFGRETAGLLDRIVALKDQSPDAYELEIVGLMHIFFSRLLRQTKAHTAETSDDGPSDLKLQKDMVSFIYQHYAEKISLADIAAAGHVCRNKCCLVFKRYLGQPPIDFLNAYRLKVSCDLLSHTRGSITQIALSCGFNHTSYYSKLFLRVYGCTPKEYRRANAPVDVQTV